MKDSPLLKLNTGVPLNKTPTAQFELSFCDDDIKEHFGATEDHIECMYSPGLPIKIQTARLLRKILHELEVRNYFDNCHD